MAIYKENDESERAKKKIFSYGDLECFIRREYFEACLGVKAEKFEKRRVFHNILKKCKFDLWMSIFTKDTIRACFYTIWFFQ